MKRLIAVLLGCVMSAGAWAQDSGIEKELTGYRQILVSFSQGAADCGLTDEATFRDHLSERLGEIGLQRTSEVYSVILLGISGSRTGTSGGRCISSVEMAFGALLSKDNIVTSDQNLMAAVERLGTVQVIIYKDGSFGETPIVRETADGPITSVPNSVLGMIDGIVDRLAAKRQ